MSKNNEYWFCFIGPTTRSKLPSGADGPMRFAIKDKFREVTGDSDEVCSSGWGMTETMRDRVRSIMHKSPEVLKEIDEILRRDTNHQIAVEGYNQGWLDEETGSSTTMRDNTYYQTAYEFGALDKVRGIEPMKREKLISLVETTINI